MTTPDKSSVVPQAQINETMRLFLRVNRMHRKEVEKRVSDLGIHHSQHRMLMYISGRDQLLSQRELADALGISPAAVTSTLKCLEKEGYVERVMTEEDNRRNRVTITEKGKQKALESCCLFDSVDRMTFDGFSEEELDTLRTLLGRMRNNLALGENNDTPDHRLPEMPAPDTDNGSM